MLRPSSNVARTVVWKSPVVSFRRHNASAADSNNGSARTPLSARLGGSGRGQPLDASADPFSAFLANAKKEGAQRNNRRSQARRMPLDPNRQKLNTQTGQFDDADEDSQSTRFPAEAQASRRQSQKPRRSNKDGRSSSNQKQQSGAVSASFSRVTTFIDKDIDWASLSPLTNDQTQASVDQDEEQLKLESEGDYKRYLTLSEGVDTSNAINVHAICSLMGGNTAYSLQQKASFVALVSKVAAADGQAAKEAKNQ